MTLLQPDDYRTDWYGYACNQAGHAAIVGIPAALLLVPFFGTVPTPIIIAAVYGILWEIIIQRGRMWADSVEDTAHVMAGSSIICGVLTGYWTALICAAAWLALLALGIARRMFRELTL